MKLKELERTATTCWAPFIYPLPAAGGLATGGPAADGHEQPVRHCPVLACGSVSGAMDASFSSTTELELFALDLSRPATTLKAGGLVRLGVAQSATRWVDVD